MDNDHFQKIMRVLLYELKRTTLHACGKPRCKNNIDGDCRLKSIVIDATGKCLYFVE